MGLSDVVWEHLTPIRRAVLDHPFLQGLTSGSLPPEAFARFVVQDALYLREFSRALALAAARAPDAEEIRMFALHAGQAIDVERALHDDLMDALGIDPAVAAGAEPSPSCRAYTSFLLATAALGERHEAVAALLPCYRIYWEVGHALALAGSPDPRYRRWIETYASEEFAAAVTGEMAALDRSGRELASTGRNSALRHAELAARYEWMFWESALRDERWPLPASSTTASAPPAEGPAGALPRPIS